MNELGLSSRLALACAAAFLASPSPTQGARTVELVSNDASYVVVYETQPAEIPLNEPFAIDLRVFNAGDERRPAADVELRFDARMPEHRHGMRVRPAVERLGDGRFRVEGAVLHMPGSWELHFDLVRGAITERAQVRVDLD